MTSILAPYEVLIDRDYGIINSVRELRSAAGSPNLFRFSARACDTAALGGLPNFNKAGGAALTREHALAKAIGEAVERYCSAFVSDDLRLHSFDEADADCVAPSRWALFSDAQYAAPGFPYQRFTMRSPVRWVEATNLATGKRLLVPACMVYVPYRCAAGEVTITQPISTGLASHRSAEAAAVSALCEVIERDAFMLWWQARCVRQQIGIETLPASNQDLVERFEVTGRRIFLFDLTTDLRVAAIGAVQTSDSPDLPPVAFAAAAHPKAEVAIRKTLEEIAHTSDYMATIGRDVPALPPREGHTNIVDQTTHLRFWCDRANIAGADFVFSDETTSFDDLPNAVSNDDAVLLQNVVDAIVGAGLDPLIVDLTTDDVRVCGFSVIRALIPGCHPLFMGHAVRPLGGTRLREVPSRMRWRHKPVIGDADNPFPHPFP